MNHFTLDAQQQALNYVRSAASYIEPSVYEENFPDIDYATLVPVDTSAPEFVQTVEFRSWRGAGKAGWINGNAKDVPVVGMASDKHMQTVHTAGIGYEFGWEEVGFAQMMGVPLEADRAKYARRAYEEFVQGVAFEGDAESGLTGLFNSSGVPIDAVPADGTGSSALWEDKTPDLILRDINLALTGVLESTNAIVYADTLLLPYQRLNAIAWKRIENTSMPVLEYFRKYNAYTANTGNDLTIKGRRGLDTAGAGGTARMVAYRRSPEVLKMHIPMPHRFLPAQPEGLHITVPGVFRLAGVDVRRPQEVRYVDGI